MAITADVATIQQASQDVLTTKENINGQLNTLGTLIEELRGGWQGAAALAFGGVMEKYQEEATTLLTALEAISEQLKSTGHAIEANEQDAAQELGKFGVL